MDDRSSAVRNELETVLASDVFAAAPMLAAFLRYVVEETLAGREDRIKAYSIATGALGRPDGFDPNDNPLVRVQARRLRQALQRHYELRGGDVALRIDLPIGSYVPLFLDAGSPPRPLPAAAPPLDDDEDDAPAPAPASPPRRPLAIGALAGLAVLAVAVALAAVFATGRMPGFAPSAPSATGLEETAVRGPTRSLDAARVLPLLAIDVDVRNTLLVGFDGEIYRNRIEAFAQRFDDTVVVTRRSPDFPPPPGQPFYRLSFLVDREGASTNVYYRLLHVGDERIVRSGALSMRPAAEPESPADLALVRDFVQLHGAISQDLANLGDIAPELACLTRAWHYYIASTPENHAGARACLEPVVAENPRLAPALTMLGAMYLSEYRQGFAGSSSESVQRAEELLRGATQVAPASSAPLQRLQNLLLIKGDIEAALLAGARSVELNPEDMNAVGGYGAVLARVGRPSEALPLLRRAAANMGAPPKWLQFYAFLALNSLGRTEEADGHVAFFDGTRSSLYLTAVAVRALHRGDTRAAEIAVAAIADMEPDFATDRRAYLARRGFTPAVADRLLADLAPVLPAAR